MLTINLRGAGRLTLAVLLGVSATLTPGVAAAATSKCPAPGGAKIAAAKSPAAEVVFSGHGYGHSLGMSQYGAQGAARLGCSYREILGTYYSGSVATKRSMPAEMQLHLLVDGTRADVRAEGKVAWRLAGCKVACPPVQPAGAIWRVRIAKEASTGKQSWELYDVVAKKVVWTGGALGVWLASRHSGGVIAVDTFVGSRSYLSRKLRWDETRYRFDAAGLDAVQVLQTGYVPALGRTVSAMDKYLWGLGEVPLSWTRDAHEALKAQVVAARTYAHAKLSYGTKILYATTVHQHYSGYAKESEDTSYRNQHGRNFRWADAVLSTSDTVLLTTTGKIVDTFFTSSHGGRSEDERYVWGGTRDIPYLRVLDDSAWDAASSNNYLRSWARGFTKAQLASKFGLDSLTGISVPARGTTARHAGVQVAGIKAGQPVTKQVAGDAVRRLLGLPSPGFAVAVPAPLKPVPPRLVTPSPRPLTQPKPKAVVREVTPPGVPKVTKVSKGPRGGKLTATVFWAAPASTGGSAITGYRVKMIRVSTSGKVLKVYEAAVRSGNARYYVATLPEGKYRFRVLAWNAKGKGDWSRRTAKYTPR